MPQPLCLLERPLLEPLGVHRLGLEPCDSGQQVEHLGEVGVIEPPELRLVEVFRVEGVAEADAAGVHVGNTALPAAAATVSRLRLRSRGATSGAEVPRRFASHASRRSAPRKAVMAIATTPAATTGNDTPSHWSSRITPMEPLL